MVTATVSVGQQILKQSIIQLGRMIKEGELRVEFPDGSVKILGKKGSAPRADITVVEWECLRKLLTQGEIGLGEAYTAGMWTSKDLVRVLCLLLLNRKYVNKQVEFLSFFSRLRDIRLHRSRRNTVKRAKENIHEHYDLGNDFFELFLDSSRTYSCAVFQGNESLEQAQENKYRRICEKAELTSGDHILEIGSGWGGFAIFAAKNYGCNVTTITISEEQYKYVQERIASEGLMGQVRVVMSDYRLITGRFDKIISIEMLEAVGAEYFEEYFEVCDNLLRENGKVVIQTITVPERSFAAVRDGINWIQKYIFPGGMLPSVAQIEIALANTELILDSTEDIGLNYCLTLREWRDRFTRNREKVQALGFEQKFIRMWEYYLAVCEASFALRNTSDHQIVLVKPAGIRLNK